MSHYERLFKKVQMQRSKGSLYSTPTIPYKRKKQKRGLEDYKDKVTAAGEYHAGSNNPNTKLVE